LIARSRGHPIGARAPGIVAIAKPQKRIYSNFSFNAFARIPLTVAVVEIPATPEQACSHPSRKRYTLIAE
jgi:hypothetical protein